MKKKTAAIALVAVAAFVALGAMALDDLVVGHEIGPSVSELAENGQLP